MIAGQELYPEVLNGKIYVAGGLLSQNLGFTEHFESYDPINDAWIELRSLPEARHHITLSAVNGLLYGVGGFTGGFPDWRAQPTMFIYDPTANTWTQGTDLPMAHAEAISAVVDDKIYLIGGRVRATEDAWLFDDHIDSVRNGCVAKTGAADGKVENWVMLQKLGKSRKPIFRSSDYAASPKI